MTEDSCKKAGVLAFIVFAVTNCTFEKLLSLSPQVVSSSNVGGRLLCHLNGGLNYQIEHHLFPRVSHVHYPTIAPVVRRFCEERGVPYVHFEGVGENVSSCALHLFDMGNNASPAKAVVDKLIS